MNELGETWCYEMLRRTRWPDGVTCPFCRHRHTTTHSKPADTPRRRYLCLACRRTFTDLTGTPFSGTNLPLRTWFGCLRLVGGMALAADLARILGVKWDTAASLQRRLVVALARPGLVRELRTALERANGWDKGPA